MESASLKTLFTGSVVAVIGGVASSVAMLSGEARVSLILFTAFYGTAAAIALLAAVLATWDACRQ